MSWIDQFSKATFRLYAGNVVDAFQPLDFFHFYPMYYDLWMKRLAEVVTAIDVEDKSYQDLKHLLPVPSSRRATLQKLVPSYQGVVSKNPDDFKKVADFFARMLAESCPNDPFAEKVNQCHSETEIVAMLKKSSWHNGDMQSARRLGQLITAIGSLGHGLYNDLGVDFCWDAYGPYDVEHEGKKRTLLIRHFTNLQPKELWPSKYLASVNDIKIFALYEDVTWEVPYVGCHATPVVGSPATGLRNYYVEVDGQPANDQEVSELIAEISEKAVAIYKEIKAMSFEELKQKVMMQECYQQKSLFDAAKIDWQPTSEMVERVKNKPLMTDILPHGKMMTDFEEYKEIFGINLFAKEVLKVDA